MLVDIFSIRPQRNISVVFQRMLSKYKKRMYREKYIKKEGDYRKQKSPSFSPDYSIIKFSQKSTDNINRFL